MADRRRTKPTISDSVPPVDVNALFGAMTDIVFVLDRDGRYLWAAPTLAGRHPEGRKRGRWLMGKTIHQALGDDAEADRLFAALRRAIDTGETQNVEYSVDVFGTTMWYSAAISKIDDDRVVWVARDITEKVAAGRLMEQAVEERTRELGLLLDVSRSLSSNLMLQPLAEAILRHLKDVIDYSGASIARFEEDGVRIVESIGPAGREDEMIGNTVDFQRASGWYEEISAGHGVIIDDVWDEDDEMAQAYRRSVGKMVRHKAYSYVRSWMGVPLRIEDRVIGMLNLVKDKPGFFTQRHLELAGAVASQGAVAAENAQLFEQTQQRARELSTLLEVSRELTSAVDFRSLAQAILREMKNVIDYTGTSVVVTEGNGVRVIDSTGPGGREEDIVGLYMDVDKSLPLWQTVMSGSPVIVDDITKDDEPFARDLQQILGERGGLPAFQYIRSWMCVPLATENAVIGMLTMTRDEPGFFNRRHAELATAVARQAAVVAQNAELFEETQQHAREMATLLEVSRQISSAVDFQSLTQAILREIKSVIDYSGASVLVLEPDAVRIVEYVGPQGRLEAVVGMHLDVDTRSALWARVLNGNSVVIADAGDDSEVFARDVRTILATNSAFPAFQYIRSWMCLPLMLEGRVVGVLTMSKDEPGFFTERHVELATAVARQAAVVAQNAELFEETQRRSREQAALLEISRALSSTLELDRLLNLILDQLKMVVPYSGAGIDLVVDGEVRQLAVRRPPGYPTDPAGSDPVPIEGVPEPFAALLRNEPLYITDVLDDSDGARLYRQTWGGDLKGTSAEWVRCILLVPMFVRDRMVGLLNVAHTQPAFFTDEHIGILQSIASQAATAVDNARLYEEVQQRAGESRALLGTAKAIVSTLELQPLLEVVLDELRNVIPYDGAGVSLLEGDYFSQIAVRRPAGESSAPTHRLPVNAADKLTSKILSGETMVVDDIASDSEDAKGFRAAWGGPLKGSAIGYVRSWVGVPLISRDRVIGMLTIVKSEPGFFTDEHVAIGQVFAGHAAAAIENARLYEETQRRAREMEALLEVSRTVASTLDASEVLGTILDQLNAITEHTGASILLFREDGLEFVEARSITGVRAQSGARIPFDVAPALLAEMRQGKTVIIDDIRADEPLAADYRAAIESVGISDQPPFNVIRSWMTVPLALQDRVLGSLTISWTEPSYFTQDHARLARAFADQAAVAMENARLYDEARQRARESEGLLEVAGAVVSTLDLRELMQVILDQAGQIVERTGSAIVIAGGGASRYLGRNVGTGPRGAARRAHPAGR